jgi:hypothetical protein
MLAPSNLAVLATDESPLSVTYWAVARVTRKSDFYVEISSGDVHAPRLIDYPPGTPLPSPIPVLAYCKPINSLNSADWKNTVYVFDGEKWTGSGFFDYGDTYEQFTMLVDADSAIVDTNLGIDNPGEVLRAYKGGFDRVSIYTRDFIATQEYTAIDDLSITGGELVPNIGACCKRDATCEVMSEAACGDVQGFWKGAGNPCPPDGDFVCCPYPFADSDSDEDVDQVDFGAFQVCYTGPDGGVPAGCDCFDRDDATGAQGGDGDVDEDDFTWFTNCVSGPTVPLDVENPPAGCIP